MRKSIILLVLASLTLSACNLPLGQARASATPESEQVATQVSTLLTAQPTSAPSLTSVPTSTVPPAPTKTSTLQAPLDTPTPAPTLTVSPNDPKASLGDPAWKNTFSTGKGFALETPYEDDNVRMAVENNALVMTGLQSNGWHSWRLTSPKVQDFYLEATTRTQTCSGNDLYGLVVRAPDFESGQGYYYGISCDGQYNFGKWQDQGLSDIAGLTQSDAILSGSNQTNVIGIKTDGSKISLYANGKLLREVDDSTFGDAGYFGVWIAANQTDGFTVQIQQMALWKLR